MKVLSYIISLIFLWSTGAMAFAPGFLQVCSSGSSASSCSASTNEVGVRSGGTAQQLNGGYVWAWRVQADCSGTLNTAYADNGDANDESVKVLLYNSTNSNLTSDTGATRVAVSNVITSGSSVGLKSNTLSVSGDVVSGNYYWLVLTTSGGWKATRDGTVNTVYYQNDSGAIYASPPSQLSTSGWSDAAFTYPYVYITIGN